MQRTPSGPTQRASRVTDAIRTGMWQLVSSGSKALTGRQNQSQNLNAKAAATSDSTANPRPTCFQQEIDAAEDESLVHLEPPKRTQ